MKPANSISISRENIDTAKSVSVYGVDPLVSMEIRIWVFTVMRSNVGIFDVLRPGLMTGLAMKSAENGNLVKEEVRTNLSILRYAIAGAKTHHASAWRLRMPKASDEGNQAWFDLLTPFNIMPSGVGVYKMTLLQYQQMRQS